MKETDFYNDETYDMLEDQDHLTHEELSFLSGYLNA